MGMHTINRPPTGGDLTFSWKEGHICTVVLLEVSSLATAVCVMGSRADLLNETNVKHEAAECFLDDCVFSFANATGSRTTACPSRQEVMIKNEMRFLSPRRRLLQRGQTADGEQTHVWLSRV